MEVIAIIAIVLGSFFLLFGLCCCLIGFRGYGVADGSCAACCQSSIGNVNAGSCFAVLTCLGMKRCFILMILIGLIILISIGIYYLIEYELIRNAYYYITASSTFQSIFEEK